MQTGLADLDIDDMSPQESKAMAITTGLVVEDMPDTRNWLEDVMSMTFPGIRIMVAATLAEAREAISSQVPDVALIDLGLPDGSGISLISELNRSAPQTLSVVATIYDDDHHVFPALRAGARGYLLKEQDKGILSRLLKGITSGEPPLSPSIARKLLHFFQPEPVQESDCRLTQREEDVLRLIAKGYKLADVGTMLNISRHTVAGYVKTIYRKLNVSTRAEATLEATRMGIVQPGG